jgi:hypothetical protein
MKLAIYARRVCLDDRTELVARESAQSHSDRDTRPAFPPVCCRVFRHDPTTTALVSTWAKGLYMLERQLQIGTQGSKLALILEIKIQTTWRIYIVIHRRYIIIIILRNKTKQTPLSESASELYRPSDHRLSGEWFPTFADKGCHVVSMTDPYGRIIGFLDRSRYCSIK